MGIEYNYRFGLDYDLNEAPKVPNWKWENLPEDHLPEQDGRFDENYDSDAMENGGIYGFSEDEEVDELFDLEMLGVKIETMKMDPAEDGSK